ncbi:hypothetical protein Tco_0102818 [Tanacetum coccineum]
MDNDSEQEADDDIGYDPFDIRGDAKVDLTDEESSDDEDDFAEVFRIDTNIFDYETPLCSAFKEFNYLLEDIIGFKTYEDYKDDWIYEWNKDVSWVDEKPWTDAGYVVVKEDEYDDLTITRKEACRAYQEIFQIMDEGWMVTTAE